VVAPRGAHALTRATTLSKSETRTRSRYHARGGSMTSRSSRRSRARHRTGWSALYIGTDFDPGTRVGRITKRLNAQAKLSIDDVQSAQADVVTEYGPLQHPVGRSPRAPRSSPLSPARSRTERSTTSSAR
jgi:hypothetical protein